MQGQKQKNIIAENLRAISGLMSHNQTMGKAKRMCWKCQKDKVTKGGELTMFKGGPMKFICIDCVNARKLKT